MKNRHKQSAKEAILILVLASVFGFVVNQIHPKAVKITGKRPSLEFAADTVLALNLPIANIKNDQGEHVEKQNVIEKPLIINTTQVLRLLTARQAILIDARSKEEYLKMHISEAQNLPFESLPDYITEINSLPYDKWLICYCDGPPCELGEQLAYVLFDAGYQKAAIYYEGLKAWKKAGYNLQGREENSLNEK